MNLEQVLDMSLTGIPMQIAGVAAACTLVLIGLAVQRRRRASVEPPPRPRPISIETELQMDVKRRWKSRFQKQPFSGRS